MVTSRHSLSAAMQVRRRSVSRYAAERPRRSARRVASVQACRPIALTLGASAPAEPRQNAEYLRSASSGGKHDPVTTGFAALHHRLEALDVKLDARLTEVLNKLP